MAIVRDFVYLNRNLRKTLQSSLQNHRKSIDGRLWPIIYLSLKIMRHHEALETLDYKGYGSEAGIVLRSMFEAVVNLMWISQDMEERIPRYTAYQVYDSQKYRDYATKQETQIGLSEKELQLRDKLFSELSEQAKDMKEKYGFKPNKHWSGKSLREMCKDLGWIERYDTLYKIYSDIAHSNILASKDYISIEPNGMMRIINESQPMHCKASLHEAFIYLYFAFEFLDIFLDLGMEEFLEKIYMRLPKQ